MIFYNEESGDDSPVALEKDPSDRDAVKSTHLDDSVTLDETHHVNIFRFLYDELYPHWFFDHLDYASFKIVLRTWLQYWICALLTIIDKPSRYLGSAGYVINIGSSIEASGNISIASSVLIGTAAVSFMFYGVLCTAVANAITWHMRGYPTKEGTMAELASKGLCEYGDERCLFEHLQRGMYLTTKCSVIHFIAMIWALASIGWISTRYKIFLLSWYFFSIPLALSCVGCVLIPYFDPWHYAKEIVVPISFSSCARVFFSIIIFPTTSSRRFMGKCTQTISRANEVLAEFMAQQKSILPSHRDFIVLHRNTRLKLHSLFKLKSTVQTDKLLARFEFSYTRFKPSNLIFISATGLEIGSAMSDHLFFYTELQKHAQTYKVNLRPVESHTHKLRRYLSTQKTGRKPQYEPYRPIGAFEREMKRQYSHILTTPSEPLEMQDLDEFFTVVTSHYSAVAEECSMLLSAIVDWLQEADSWRTYSLLSPKVWRQHQKQQLVMAENLLTRTAAAEQVLKDLVPCEVKHLRYFCKQPQFTQEMASYYGFASITLTKRILILAKYLTKLDSTRPVPTLLTPGSHSKTKSWFSFFKGVGKMNLLNEDDRLNVDEVYEKFQPLSRVQARDPETTPPKNRIHLFGRFILRVWNACTDDIVLLALKRALFTAACYIPAYCRTTCHLFFSKRLGWASAMVALTVSRQAVDGIYGFVIRILFTFYGCGVACAGWYIARGNAIGHAAVLAVLFAYLSFHRHFCNHLNAVCPIILSLSIVIVMGGSYSVAKLDPVGLELSPGWEVAWVRAVCVSAGLGIALIGTFFPRPNTGKHAIRSIEGAMMSRITDLIATVSHFSMERYGKPRLRAESRTDGIEEKTIKFFTVSQSADSLAQFLRFEPPLGGKWPKNRYKILTNIQQELAQIIWMIYLMFDEVTDVTETIPQLLWRLGWTSPTISQSTYSLLYMSARAIASGQPLPAISPCYLSEMHGENARHLIDDDLSEIPVADRELAHVAAILGRLLYERLDGLMLLVKGLVGETFDADTRLYHFDEEFREKMNKTA